MGRKLVLHLDLNLTLAPLDAATGQDPAAALNAHLSGRAWGAPGPKGEWQWLSDSASLLPPCQGAVSFSSQYGRDAAFTATALGRRFRSLHTHHLQLLEWRGQPHPALSVSGEHGQHYHLLLPSFFHLLETLHQEGRHFAVILRTFGTDLPRALHAVHCALEGQHPQFPALRDLSLPVDLTAGRIRCSEREVVLSQGAERVSSRDGGRKLYSYFSSLEGVVGFQDHFDWWASNQFSCRGGKPVWIDPHDSCVQHIFIDDNVRPDDSDSIVCPQVFLGRGGSRARPAPAAELYDTCLVQADFLEAIAEQSYFRRCVRRRELWREEEPRTCLAGPATDPGAAEPGLGDDAAGSQEEWSFLLPGFLSRRSPQPPGAAGVSAAAAGARGWSCLPWASLAGRGCGGPPGTMPVPAMAAATASSFCWEVFPPMPTCRVYCSPAYRDGHLFVVGGCGRAGLPLAAAEMLDVPSQTWLALPPLPTARAGAAAVAVGKQVLVVGGMDSRQSPLASVDVFNTDEGKWEPAAALAQPSMGVSAVERDGVVYALGGMGADTSPQALVRLYEPGTARWQPLPSMPTPCYGASAFLQGSKIFLLGGRQGKLPVTAFEAFDLETRSWTRYPSVPSRRAFAGCAVAEGCVFSLGGLQQPGPHNFYSRPHFVSTVEIFDLEQGAWSKLGRAVRMRDKRADFVAGCLGGRVVAAGGLGNQSFPLGSVEGFSPARKRWEQLPAMPTGRCSCSSYQALSRLFVIGGVAQGPSGAVEALCLREGA